MTAAHEAVPQALKKAVHHLLSAMVGGNHWEGHLSSSALSTATAISALSLARSPHYASLIRDGLAWLIADQNPDGGWGDTPDSPSNLATTLLAVAAMRLSPETTVAAAALDRAEAYLCRCAGATPEQRAQAVLGLYGADRTFAVPILTNCALAGLVPWNRIPRLPFELAALPHRWHRTVRLQVVSYALPALIAVGLLLHERNPTSNPLTRAVRHLLQGRVLRTLAAIQPEHGGFLEATPLTSFVAMSLTACTGLGRATVQKCLGFLEQSVRDDGSWPIDTNLATWLTSSAVTALARAGELPWDVGAHIRRWLLACQFRHEHPFTHAAPGGWGWTDLPGAVPDADDTACAMLALAYLGELDALRSGARWLLGLQNRDGGWPTFCQGWGHLPFDRSSPDITAHVLRALAAAHRLGQAPDATQAIHRGFRYLQETQRPDGSWVPLWFGSQLTDDHTNPVLGTSRVLMAFWDSGDGKSAARRAVRFLLDAQGTDGAWGPAAGHAPSVEETALAVTALTRWPSVAGTKEAADRGSVWLAERVLDGSWIRPAPIGLYFASLWYSEQLYPIIWTAEALGRTLRRSPAIPGTREHVQ